MAGQPSDLGSEQASLLNVLLNLRVLQKALSQENALRVVPLNLLHFLHLFRNVCLVANPPRCPLSPVRYAFLRTATTLPSKKDRLTMEIGYIKTNSFILFLFYKVTDWALIGF